jgi:hypothetical protein
MLFGPMLYADSASDAPAIGTVNLFAGYSDQ